MYLWVKILLFFFLKRREKLSSFNSVSQIVYCSWWWWEVGGGAAAPDQFIASLSSSWSVAAELEPRDSRGSSETGQVVRTSCDWDSALCSVLQSTSWLAGLISGVCCGGQDSLLRITDQEQCLFSQIKPDNGVGFHVNISSLYPALPCPV